MELDVDNWFSEDGRNESGYRQIRERLTFLQKEYKNLDRKQRKYELRVIDTLIGLIMVKDTKISYDQIKQKTLSKLVE